MARLGVAAQVKNEKVLLKNTTHVGAIGPSTAQLCMKAVPVVRFGRKQGLADESQFELRWSDTRQFPIRLFYLAVLEGSMTPEVGVCNTVSYLHFRACHHPPDSMSPTPSSTGFPCQPPWDPGLVHGPGAKWLLCPEDPRKNKSLKYYSLSGYFGWEKNK